MTGLSTGDKLPDETWFDYWSRKHDERHEDGMTCKCAWNQVNYKRRFERRYGE